MNTETLQTGTAFTFAGEITLRVIGSDERGAWLAPIDSEDVIGRNVFIEHSSPLWSIAKRKETK